MASRGLRGLSLSSLDVMGSADCRCDFSHPRSFLQLGLSAVGVRGPRGCRVDAACLSGNPAPGDAFSQAPRVPRGGEHGHPGCMHQGPP